MLASPGAELVALYGRRRVGKTTLVREHLEPLADTFLAVTGEKDAPAAIQLRRSTGLGAGVSADPVPWLSLGLGVSILANLTGSATMALDITNSRFERREFGVDLNPAIAVLAGVHVRPAPGLSLGFSWRGSNSISFGLPVDVREEEALTLLLDVAQTVLWAPHQLSAGISYTAPELGLTVAADLTIAMWIAM